MRGFGVLAVVIGILVMLGAMVMDVSVSSGMGRVNNLGLMADRQNYTIIGGVLLIAGLLMTMLGRRNQITQADAAGAATRPCPLCAEPIKLAAIKCKHCGADVEPIAAPRLRNGWVASIPCKPEDVDRLHEAIRSLALPLVNMAEGQWGVGPYESKSEARDALATLHETYKFYGDIVYRDSVSGKYPPIID
ncbi:hypothetical protein SAMN04489802_2809 [Pseudomonas chlororaphis]|uniref:hypothetical protein n=1 Tax=Pseudomonas chlororaphis TaxID=587753 RepID=UPI00087BB197|nr:hypothetical protein [Pseudomonas chlororaphis]AZD67603.1 hypothetical protein C4K17_3717 [Pseudomonas chlororaphis subsp. aurantiaca]QIT23574.1 hypothetical protein HCN09_18190 [Pseudomonas chlororaphis subsp. aurantiaca]WDH01668.1 hypothetical protein PUP57_19315 [Pseudomonas chlororaphis]WDH09484.1 hypothetical protein PUP64_27695 [Pseudomonas chlororaphis]SDS97598.1 hypothetical protein SAMN04489802_2809 [Pseudomonas chlororaphis]